jgi:hypothetical protein
MSMLTKLMYVVVSTEDLIDILILFVSSLTEYCTVAFHSSLTVAQATSIERNQKTSLIVVLGDNSRDVWLRYISREKDVNQHPTSKHPGNSRMSPEQ